MASSARGLPGRIATGRLPTLASTGPRTRRSTSYSTRSVTGARRRSQGPIYRDQPPFPPAHTARRERHGFACTKPKRTARQPTERNVGACPVLQQKEHRPDALHAHHLRHRRVPGCCSALRHDRALSCARRHRDDLTQPPAGPSDSEDAAAATAAFRVLVGLFPAQQPTLQPLYDSSLAAVVDTPPGAKAGGIAAGEAAAAAMLAARANDGQLRPVHPRDRDHARSLATDTAALRAGPRSLGRKRTTVPGPQRRDAAQRWPQRADQPRVREGLQ